MAGESMRFKVLSVIVALVSVLTLLPFSGSAAGLSAGDRESIQQLIDMFSINRSDFDFRQGVLGSEASLRSALFSPLFIDRRFQAIEYPWDGRMAGHSYFQLEDVSLAAWDYFGQDAAAFSTVLDSGRFSFPHTGFVDSMVRLQDIRWLGGDDYLAEGIVLMSYSEEGDVSDGTPAYQALVRRLSGTRFGFVILMQHIGAAATNDFADDGTTACDDGIAACNDGTTTCDDETTACDMVAQNHPTRDFDGVYIPWAQHPDARGITFNLWASSTRGKSTLDHTSTYYVDWLLDKNDKTSWQTKEGVGAFLQADFSQPVSLSHLKIKNGYWKSNNRYYRNNRVADLSVSYRLSGSDSFVQEEFHRLADSGLSDWQTIRLAPNNQVESIRITILSIYPARAYGGSPPFPEDTALNELEIYGGSAY
jgi:hypothetical protein